MSIAARARAAVRALQHYEAGQQVDGTIRLNANELPFAPGTGAFRRPLNRYPEVRPTRLQALLATRFGCDAAELLVTRGSSEGIDLLIRSFCEPREDSLVLCEPAFAMYRHYAVVQGANIIEIQADAAHDFAVDVSAILAAADDTTRLVFVCSPNNPTGAPVPRADLVFLLRSLADRAIVVLDEAYVEFGSAGSVVDLLESHDNLALLRTLSKALGYAGARCGAVIARPDVIQLLSAVQAPYAISTPVVESVEDALLGPELEQAERHVATIIAERQRLIDALPRFSFVRKVWPSEANFLLASVADAADLVAFCRDNGILIRYYGAQLPGCVRISVGSKDDNDALLDLFAAREAAH